MLEIDALPERLDLKDEHVRKAVAAGVAAGHRLRRPRAGPPRFPDALGIAVARRGWARREDVINTLPVEKFLARLKGHRRRAPARTRPTRR